MRPKPYGPPVLVSPLIRGARFALLIAGIVYGGIKQRMYSAMEDSWREEEAQRKIIRDLKMAQHKREIAAEESRTVKLLETGELFPSDNPSGTPSGTSFDPPSDSCCDPSDPCCK